MPPQWLMGLKILLSAIVAGAKDIRAYLMKPPTP